MDNIVDNAGKTGGFWEKFLAVWEKICMVYHKIGEVCGFITTWIFRLRKIFMAIPVVYLAMMLAAYCRENLPEEVGVDLLSTGEFATLMERGACVNGCLLVTFACLALMFLSRRASFPWVISIFTLALPLLILATNNFDAFLLLATESGTVVTSVLANFGI